MKLVVAPIFGSLLLAASHQSGVTASSDIETTSGLRGLKQEGTDKEKEDKKNPFKGAKLVTKNEVKGGKVKKVGPKESGKPVDTMKGIKKMKEKELTEMEELPETGLFLLDTDFIPRNLEEQLKKLKLNLKDDGTLLDDNGVKVALIVKGEVLDVEAGDDEDNDDGPDGRRLAWPYPLGQVDFGSYWYYTLHGWYFSCRDFTAWTTAESFGPLQGGIRPHTQIEYMETRALLGGRAYDWDTCNSCDGLGSWVGANVGCWWPTGGQYGWHYAHFKDGSFSLTRTDEWAYYF